MGRHTDKLGGPFFRRRKNGRPTYNAETPKAWLTRKGDLLWYVVGTLRDGGEQHELFGGFKHRGPAKRKLKEARLRLETLKGLEALAEPVQFNTVGTRTGRWPAGARGARPRHA